MKIMNLILIIIIIMKDYDILIFSNVVVDCLKLPLITAALISTVRLLKTWKHPKSSDN